MKMPVWRDFSPLKKILIIFASVLAILALGLGYFYSQGIEVVIPSSKISYDCEPGKSALKVLLKNRAAKLQETSLGALVIEIDGIAQGGGKYWQYQVDNKEATIGAEAYICQTSEKILWELK